MKKTILAACAAALLTGTGCLNMGDALSNLRNQMLLGQLLNNGYNRFQVYVNSGTAFHESSGDGIWTRVTFTGAPKIIDVAQSGSTLFGLDGQTGATVWKSVDYGRTWTAVAVGTGGFYHRIAACGTNIVVARNGVSTYDADTFYSTNSGATWSTSTLQVNPAIGTTAAIADLTCQGSRFFISVSRSSSQLAYVNAPAFSAWTSVTAAPLFPYSLINQIAVSDLLLIQYFSSTGAERHISTDNGQTFSGSSLTQDVTGGAPTLSFGDSFFYRAYTSSPNCLIDTSANAASVSWTNNKSFNCGAGASVTTSAAGVNKLVAGGSTGAGTTFVMRYDRTALTLATETLAGASAPVSRVFFVK